MKIVILKLAVTQMAYIEMTSLAASFSTVRRTFVMFKVPLESAIFAPFKYVFNFGLLLAEDTLQLHGNRS